MLSKCILEMIEVFFLIINLINFGLCNEASGANGTNKTHLRIKRPLMANYSRRAGERVRFDCEFELSTSLSVQPSEISLYWVKNYQEIIQPKRGETTVVRRNLSTMLIMKNLETFDSGSYMCMAELSIADKFINASSETTLFVSPGMRKSAVARRPSHESLSDYLLSDLETLDDDDDLNLSDEFPSLNPTIVENVDDKGFCEPYRGSICAGIITNNYSIYSTSSQQQELIEDRLKSILPLLLKNNLSKRCSTFALPSLCLFAFPLCDRHTKQPKQICRFDCKQLQQDICKNEYFNVKSLFDIKLGDASLQSNFMLDCDQLPPSSDLPGQCLPIVTMTLEKLESRLTSKINEANKDDKQEINCIKANGVDYTGRQSITRNGYQCQAWHDQFPHMHDFNNIRQLNGHNYCRNPDNDIEPWCFTTNPHVRKDYCQIAKCADTMVAMTTTKLIDLLYILLPSICIPFFLFFLFVTFCLCRKAKSVDESIDDKTMAATATAANRLRMSNMSLGKKSSAFHKNSYRHTESSKSSVVSSNAEPYKPYDNHYNPQFAQPLPPLPHAHHLAQLNECNPLPALAQLKHYQSNQFRLVQEIGKGINY